MKETIIGLSIGYFCVGFFIGAMESYDERTSHKYESQPGGGMTTIDTSKSGCVYNSIAAFLNPGHLVACEIFRKRFDLEGFTK